jgi:hypothetical protein
MAKEKCSFTIEEDKLKFLDLLSEETGYSKSMILESLLAEKEAHLKGGMDNPKYSSVIRNIEWFVYTGDIPKGA